MARTVTKAPDNNAGTSWSLGSQLKYSAATPVTSIKRNVMARTDNTASAVRTNRKSIVVKSWIKKCDERLINSNQRHALGE